MEIINFSQAILKSDIEFSLGYIVFNNISVNKEHTSFLDDYISEISDYIKDTYSLESIKNNEIIRKYRNFYWHYLKIDPTKIRPSAEALIRRILGNKTIPQISNVVDAYNWVSIETLIPMGAYDYDVLKFPLIIRYANEGEKFIPIGGKVKRLKGHEIILADNEEKIMFQYPYRDADFSKVTTNTKNILLISCGVPGISIEFLEKSLKKYYFIIEKVSKREIASSGISIIKTKK